MSLLCEKERVRVRDRRGEERREECRRESKHKTLKSCPQSAYEVPEGNCLGGSVKKGRLDDQILLLNSSPVEIG